MFLVLVYNESTRDNFAFVMTQLFFFFFSDSLIHLCQSLCKHMNVRPHNNLEHESICMF
ncbi:hypothetical protein Patl1_26547 [Pistacia atlantica]|uniref:Uncharacterized protein n=1 Tax=Pistacia atlantica TaxID=434234 RepID=A0ACC1B253_9ROSI|nr:hypothetical protein Patl1_26547 [Pistacia atlantica]